MRLRSLAAVAVAAVATLVPAVSAVPGTFDLAVTLPGHVAGPTTLGSGTGELLWQDRAGFHIFTLAAPLLRVAEVEVWSYTPLAGTPADAAGEVDVFSDHRITESEWREGTLRLVSRQPGFTTLAWADGDARVATTRLAPDAANVSWGRDWDVALHSLSEPLKVESTVTGDGAVHASVLGQAVPFRHAVPSGSWSFLSHSSTTTLAGALGAYLAGAEVRIESPDGARDLTLGSTYEDKPGSLYVPGEGWQGPGTHVERVDRYLAVDAAEGVLTLSTRGSLSTLFAGSAALEMDGALRFTRAEGEVTAADEAHAVSAAPFVLGGALSGSLSPPDAEDAGAARLTGSGDVTFLAAGAATRTYARTSVVAAAATLTGAALLLAAIAYFWNTVKMAALGLFVPLYARVAGKEVLAHEGRDLVYELIKHEPGVSASELAQKVDFGWSALVYHLKVLERNELVISIRDGRYKRFFDMTSGLYANGRKQVVAVLRNGTTQRVAALVRARPGITQKEVAEGLGLAPSSVHWHATRLFSAGLLVKERRAQNVCYAPGEAWAKVEAMGLDAHAPPAEAPVAGSTPSPSLPAPTA